MEITRTIRKVLFVKSMLMWGCLFLMILMDVSWKWVALFFAVESVTNIIVWLRLEIPLRETETVLKECITGTSSEEKLEKINSDLPFMEMIKKVLDRCAEERTRKNSAQIYDKQAAITALQSQINPHFLYNTLESVRGQALIDGNMEIAKMMEALSAFFRYSISRIGNLVTLREELANIENYMLIQRYRFNNRFSLEIFIDEEDEEAYDYLIPKLIIQPVVENAIFHGLEELLEGGKVIIEIIRTENNLLITVSDNGKGMESTALAQLNKRIHEERRSYDGYSGEQNKNTGIALPNIHKRIQLLFGEEYGVSVYSTLTQGTDVEITVPIRYERIEE